MHRILFLLLITVSVLGYTQKLKPSWVDKPFANIGFAENKGRIGESMNELVYYTARSGNYRFYFTQTGVIIGQREKLTGKEMKERHEKVEHGEELKPWTINYFKLNWLAASDESIIIPSNQNEHTLNFQNPENLEQTILSNTFKKLTYSNIYPNIDLEFELPEEGGLKYQFIVRPGGNSDLLKMQITGATVALSASKDLLFNSKVDLMTDMAPKSWLLPGKTEVKSNYEILNDSIVQIKVGQYDKTETLIVDPWLVSALPFAEDNKGYDIAVDFYGNCSVLGQLGNDVAHYDVDGVLEWVWLSPGELNIFYGGLDMNPTSGETYYMLYALHLGIQDIWRLDQDGVVSASIYLIPADDDPGELWRLNYNRITDEVVVGAGGLPRISHLVVTDGDLTVKEQYAPCPELGSNLVDATFLEIDPLGEYIYFLASADGIPDYDNTIYKVLQSDPNTIIWETPTNYTFEEISCIGYLGSVVETGEGPDWYSPNGHNGMACSFDLYTYDGDSLSRWDKLTGDVLTSVQVTPFEFVPGIGVLTFCGGIDVDPCGNVYVGTEDSVIVYTRELEYIEGYVLEDTCYDMRWAEERLFATGKDFVEVWDYDLVSLSTTSTPQPCGACEGTASIETESVCPELEVVTVTWFPGGQTTPTATGLCAGWYTATVEWANEVGDTLHRVDSVEVVIGAPGTLNIEVENESCSGTCDGEVVITVTGGFAPFTFDLDGEVNDTGEFEGLCVGMHYINVVDVDGCVFIDSVLIEKQEDITVTEIVTDEACAGSCNGTITLIPDNGEAPFVYNLDGSTNETGFFDELCVGTYAISVTDAEGCVYTNAIEVQIGETMGLDTVAVNQPSCFGFTDGSATVGTLLGEAPISYEWVPTNVAGGATFNTLGAGIYTVYAEDANGCKDTLIFEMLQPDSIYANIITEELNCFGDANGTAVVDSVFNAQGNLDNITYIWNPDLSGSSGVGNNITTGLTAGNYILTINDDNGCANSIPFEIVQPTAIMFSEFGTEPAYCRLFGYQNGNGVVFAAATGGTPDYTYEWLNLTTTETSILSTWGGLNPGAYQITIEDGNGCLLVDTLTLDSLNPIAAFTVQSDQLNEDCEGTELVIANFINESQNFANPNLADADTTFFWNLNHPNANWQISNDFFYSPDTNYVGEAIYEVCLVAINKNGCTDTTCKNLIVHVQPEFVAPNVFSPGGNNINDEFTFELKSLGIESFRCVITNRWGTKVSELNGISDAWDGNDYGGDPCSAGVYFYTYEAVSTNGTVFTGQGTVQLIR